MTRASNITALALDEPTSSLSSRESEILFALIDRLRAEGKIIIYVSHRATAAHSPSTARQSAQAILMA